MIKIYSKKLIELFKNPKFVGEIKDPSGKGTVGNPRCGDVMEVFIKVEKKDGKEIIKDIKYRTFGCVAAIASTEALCSIVKGKGIDEALKVTKEDVIKFMGGEIPVVKVHCSVLATEALHKAIENYEKSKH